MRPMCSCMLVSHIEDSNTEAYWGLHFEGGCVLLVCGQAAMLGSSEPRVRCERLGRRRQHRQWQQQRRSQSATIAEESHAIASAMTAAAPHTAVSALTAAAPNYGSAMSACGGIERRHRRWGEHQMGGAPAFSHKVATNTILTGPYGLPSGTTPSRQTPGSGGGSAGRPSRVYATQPVRPLYTPP